MGAIWLHENSFDVTWTSEDLKAEDVFSLVYAIVFESPFTFYTHKIVTF